MGSTLQFLATDKIQELDDRIRIGIADEEVVELASAFRPFGYFRWEVSTGLMFMSPEAHVLHGLEPRDGPSSMLELSRRIHPEDLPMVLAGIEETIRTRNGGWDSFRLCDRTGTYRTVRLVAEFRVGESGGDEVVGVIYGFFNKNPMAEFLGLDDEQDAPHGADSPIRRVKPDDFTQYGLSLSEVVSLICGYRRYGFFRQELVAGRCFFSRQAFDTYGVPYTVAPADIPALIRKTHPDDKELVTRTFEKASNERCIFHLIHRYEDGAGGYKTIRVVGKYRDGHVAGGELIGIVYQFFDHLRVRVAKHQ